MAMSDSMEVIHRLEREMADRAAAVEKVDAFKNQLAQAIKAFMDADSAVRILNDGEEVPFFLLSTSPCCPDLRVWIKWSCQMACGLSV